MPHRFGGGFRRFSQSPRAAPVVGPVRATGTRRHHSGSRLCMSTDFATHGNRVEAWLACPHRRLRGDPPLHRHRAGRSVPVVSCEDGAGHGSRVADMDESRCRGAVSQAAVGVVPAQRQDVVEAQGPGPRRRPCRCSHRPRHPAARPLRPCRRAALHGPDGVRSSARRRPRSPGCCAARGRGGSSPRGGAAACAGRLARCSSAGGGLYSEWCNSWGGSYSWAAVRRPSKVMSKAWRAGFHRLVQRFAPVPVGSRLITAR